MHLALITGLLFAASPKVGDTAPNFTASDTEGHSFTLSEMLKKGPVILAFFPKSGTSGWRKELTAYRSRYAELQGKDAQLLAISTDTAEEQKKFKDELKAPFPFIPDTDKKIVQLFDLKTFMGFVERTTFVIGSDGKILHVSTGSDAVDPAGTIASCPIHKPAAK